jgi:hypothetical protein
MAREGAPPQPEERKQQLRWEHGIPLALHRMAKPTLAALPGPAAGAGFSLALACDLRVMAESAFVTTAYVKLGLSGDYGASWFLTRLVGPAWASGSRPPNASRSASRIAWCRMHGSGRKPSRSRTGSQTVRRWRCVR